MKTHIIGFFLGFIIVTYAVMNTGNDSRIYFDIISILIVFGGSLSISIMTNGLKDTFSICMLFFKVFSTAKYNKLNITKELVELAKKYHFGNLSINDVGPDEFHPFVMDGLKLIHNKFDKNKIRTIMVNMIQQRQLNHERTVESLESLAKYPPAFGMMGTIIGLVAVLNQINSPDNMSSIGPSMAVALITTLYGIFVSNYILLPIADNLSVRGQVDIQVRLLVCEAIILLSEGNDPIYTREVLLSYLTPQERQNYQKLSSVSSIGEEVAA